METIGIGIIGGGYMGKAHAVAMSSVSAVFQTPLRPRLEMVSASSLESAKRYREDYGFNRAAANWRELVEDKAVDAVVIASPQGTHREIAEAAFKAKKHVLCEKPLGASLQESIAMTAAAEASGCINMVGFNYIRTPASQFACQLIHSGRIGDIKWFRGEHTEDFYADPEIPASWRTEELSNGALADVAPHIINAARTLIGPIAELNAEVETVYSERGGVKVKNDDQAQMMCRFASGVMGHLFVSRIATGRKMGYAYEITGEKGAIRFDQEDQNSIWLYTTDGPEAERGFRKILTGPEHPDYLQFCQGPGHGTGYADQIIIEARDFLNAISTGQPAMVDFREGLEVDRIVKAAFESNKEKQWIKVLDIS